jgi:hypothetical protein
MCDLKLGAGIDIGGRRKGFHVAAVTGAEVVAGPQGIPIGDHVVQVLKELDPVVIALDSPRTCSPPGENSRQGERDLNREICGIRWTPEEAKLAGNPYYEWIVCGRELYDALERERPSRMARHRGLPDGFLDDLGRPQVQEAPRAVDARSSQRHEARRTSIPPAEPRRQGRDRGGVDGEAPRGRTHKALW